MSPTPLVKYWIDCDGELTNDERNGMGLAIYLAADVDPLLADTVPRSRYDACNKDWLDALEKVKAVQAAATKEIDALRTRQAALEQERERLTKELGTAFNMYKHLEGKRDAWKAAHADAQARQAALEAAVTKFLDDTNAIPPWESAGAIWAQRIKELHTAWLDAQEVQP